MSILSLQNTTLAWLGSTESQDRTGSSEELWISISNLVGNLQPISYAEKMASGVPGVEYSHVFYTLGTPPAEQDILTSSTEQFRVAAIANYNQSSLDHAKVYLERLSSYDLLYLAGPPTAVVGTPHATGTSISVAFVPPINGGGSAISYYTVNVYLSDGTPVSGSTTTGAASPIVITGLSRTVAYKFKVADTNSEGMSAYSDYSAAATVVDIVPGAPTSVTASGALSTASVSFTAPTVNGGSVITRYTVTSSPDSIIATGTASPITVTGLTTTSTFTVHATNAMGSGANSAASNSVVTGLNHYYANTLGSGTITPDSVVPATSGAISGATWQDGPTAHVLRFAAGTDNVLVNSDVVGISGTVSAWVKPSALSGVCRIVSCDGPELVLNPGFETQGPGGPGTWASWYPEQTEADLFADTTVVGECISGHAAKFTSDGVGPTQISQAVAVTPGRSYTFSMYSRGDGTNKGDVYIYDIQSQTFLLRNAVLTNGVEFVRYSFSFVVPPGITSIYLILLGSTANGGIAYFDDVSLRADSFGLDILTDYVKVTNDGETTLAASASGAIATDNWYHIAVVRTAAGLATIYVNGQLSGNAAQAAGTPVAGSLTMLGNRPDFLKDFIGDLGTVSTYNRILTATEVGLLYNQEKGIYGL